MSILIRAINLVARSRPERASSPHTSNWGLRRIWLKALDQYSVGKVRKNLELLEAVTNEVASRLKEDSNPEVFLRKIGIPLLYIRAFNVLYRNKRDDFAGPVKKFGDGFLMEIRKTLEEMHFLVSEHGKRVIPGYRGIYPGSGEVANLRKVVDDEALARGLLRLIDPKTGRPVDG